MRAVLIFCEGQHDVVFVTRSLGASGCNWVNKPIRGLPSPFGDVNGQADTSFIAKRLARRSIGEVELPGANQAQPPSFQTLLHDPAADTLYAILRCHGDSGTSAAKELFNELFDLTSGDLGAFLQVKSIAAAFLYDADASRTERERVFRESFSDLIDDHTQSGHRIWHRSPRGSIGLYIFGDEATGQGTLEDSLAPLVAAHWPPRWQAAGVFLSQHADLGDPVTKKRSEMLKAQICTVGQFVFPGDPMSIVLSRHEKGLSKEAFKGIVSQDLVAFLHNAFT